MSLINKFKSIFASEEDPYIEQRNHPRVAASAKVTYSLQEGAAKENIALLNRTKNISTGGLCIIVYEKLSKGTGLYLDIVLSDSYVLKVKGEVAWQTSFKEADQRLRFETGVRFVDMDDEAYDYLSKYIASLGINK